MIAQEASKSREVRCEICRVLLQPVFGLHPLLAYRLCARTVNAGHRGLSDSSGQQHLEHAHRSIAARSKFFLLCKRNWCKRRGPSGFRGSETDQPSPRTSSIPQRSQSILLAVDQRQESGLLLRCVHVQVICPGPVENTRAHFNPFSLLIIFLLPEPCKTILIMCRSAVDVTTFWQKRMPDVG